MKKLLAAAVSGALTIGIPLSGVAQTTPPTPAIAVGSVSGDANDPNWSLHLGGEATREFRVPVKYGKRINSADVVIGISYFDSCAEGSTGHRLLGVRAENITKTGFTAVFSTASSSFICGASASWTAVGTKPNN